MNTRFFHGKITSNDIANALHAHFDRGDFIVRQIVSEKENIIQITTTSHPQSGGQTAITVRINQTDDGAAVQIGKQSLYGVAASLGKTALMTLRNPLSLLSRLDDLAQDFESIRLADEIWDTIEATANHLGASFELSEHLRRIACPYCNTANLVGESNCIACGAPLGLTQPKACPNCGFIIKNNMQVCPNCGHEVLSHQL
jgi:DNA-directed RNA polymerase subunit RPC12/RpoP